ncbi:HEAT repeat domain-containing protein [Streptomyces sp. NPDC087856]|uniref:HEAT repeat domain-containing protein n=1 Tax=Streptomyces sp. NPDC087856 TaxID=3365811 RepID=UPI00382F09B5
MSEWVTAVLCPQDVVPVNGREQKYTSGATALAYVVMGRLIELDLWRDSAPSEPIPDLLGSDLMPSYEWDLVRSALRSMLDDSQELGALELDELALNEDLPCELRVIAAVLASIAYADMESYSRSLATCERLLEQRLDLSALPNAMIQLHACMRNAEANDYPRALHWANSARMLLEEAQSSSTEVGQKIIEGLTFSLNENVTALNEALSDRAALPKTTAQVTPIFWLELHSTVGSAALEYISEDFKRRIRDRTLRRPPHRITNEDYISRNMYAYYMRVQLAGHWRRYLQASQQLGMEIMLRPVEQKQSRGAPFSQALAYLRKGWASSSYNEALRLVREEGPLEALDSELQKALNRIQVNVTDLELHVLRAGAPLLRAEEADSVVRSLLENRLPVHARSSRGWYRTQVSQWEAVAALAREVSNVDYLSQKIRTYVGAEADTQAFEIEKVVEAMDWSLVSDSEQENWVRFLAGPSTGGPWGELLQTVLYKLSEIGNRSALEMLGQIDSSELTLERSSQIVDLTGEFSADLLHGNAASIADLCVRSIAETRANSAQGVWSFGGHNGALIGAMLSIKYPAVEIWSALSAYLRDVTIVSDHKDPVLNALALRIDDVPAEVVQEISSDPARLISVHPGLFGASSQGSGALLRFLCAAEAVDGGEALQALMRLSDAEEPGTRMEAAKSLPLARKVLGEPLATGYLLNMTADPAVLVRAQAAETLGYFLGPSNSDNSLVGHRLVEMLGADGVAVPFGALRGLRLAKMSHAAFNQPIILDKLHKISRDHSMVRVRRAAKTLLA